MIHSFLMIGQSNMAGRGALNEGEPIKNPRIKMIRNGRWVKMFTPINPDRSYSGRSLAETFADLYSKEHNVDVGLIPCADGGTSLDQWRVGGLLYDNAVHQAKLASRTSTIAGILWHQGEADCSSQRYPLYEEKLTAIITSLRNDLGLHDVPFLCGALGDYLVNCTLDRNLKNYRYVNEALIRVSEKLPLVGWVPADGLTANSDNLHFNTASLAEFGKRYYRAFTLLEDKNKVFEEKPDMNSAIRTLMEDL